MLLGSSTFGALDNPRRSKWPPTPPQDGPRGPQEGPDTAWRSLDAFRGRPRGHFGGHEGAPGAPGAAMRTRGR
eukprot:6012305-Pyramimonas_sp.AAC.1